MNKKIFGIRIGTILTALLCLGAAVMFWLFAKYLDDAPTAAVRLCGSLYRGVL